MKLAYYMEMAGRMGLKSLPKVWNYAKYRMTKRESVITGYTPQIASLILTKRCNLNCGYCHIQNWISGEATLEKVKKIFEVPAFKNCLLVDLLGGEPLLVPELESIIHWLSERQGRLTNMSTNGMLLRHKIEGLACAGISRINVSLYDDTFTLGEFKECNEIFPCHCSIVLTRSMVEKNPEQVIAKVQMARGVGFQSLRFFGYRALGVAAKPEEVIRGDNRHYLDFKRKVTALFPKFVLWPSEVNPNGPRRCSQLWQRIGCDMDGNIVVCCGCNDKVSGSVFDGDCMNHSVMVDMRKRLLDADAPLPDACRMCNLLGEGGW